MRQHKILIVVLLLEVLALVLASVQFADGLVTDEAKYLLSIPYPHPPFLRSFMGWTTEIPWHEFLWRFVFASMLVQCVWFFVDLGRVLSPQRRLCFAASWLLLSSVVLGSGSIIMAVMTAAFGAVFVWTALHSKPPASAATIGLLWLLSLFTAYQAVLFLPLVVSSLIHTRARKRLILAYVGLPLLLLALYSLTNPHALLTMVQVSGQDATISVAERLVRIGWIWIVGGALIASVAGTVGILTSVRFDLVIAFGLVTGFIVLTSQEYYAILFAPLFMGGLFLLFCKRRLNAPVFLACQAVCTSIIVFLSFPTFRETPVRAHMKALSAYHLTGALLIDGFFGHEWQYESPFPIRRFSQELSAAAESKAGVFVCTKSAGCDEDINDELWMRLPNTPFPTWIRKTPGSMERL